MVEQPVNNKGCSSIQFFLREYVLLGFFFWGGGGYKFFSEFLFFEFGKLLSEVQKVF